MSQFDYDLFTIGAGSGGVRASRIASGFGAKVAVAEEYRVGGTCVIRGCVPKKLFVYASEFSKSFKAAKGFGWDVGETKFNWTELIANKDAEIDRLEGIYDRNLGNSDVKVIRDRAIIKDKHTIHLVNENRDVTAKYILIATGAAPFKPQIEGIEHAITSNEAFDLKQLPSDIVVVGGGYIAVEFAGIFNGLGVNTHLIYRGEKILRGFDQDLQDGLTAELALAGMDVQVMTDITKIEKQADGVLLHLNNGKTLKTGAIMYATGRVPHVKDLGLEALGIEQGRIGEIKVSPQSQTNVDNIYAVGDVTDRANLTPVAIREGNAVAETLFNNNPMAVDHKLIPTAVFSQPELGTIGLTEAQARDEYKNIDVYVSSFRPMKNILAGSDSKMMMKLIVDQKTDKMLGVHIMGPDAGEMIQLVGITMRMGATKADFDATMAVHPTAAEELVTMKVPTRS
ncbi:MAG: glutathione-disulfide reductase [Alphaproteobacteria bacterium]|nr:glutathione-disulfide reductase [Alphaproteobacteria bacterium]